MKGKFVMMGLLLAGCHGLRAQEIGDIFGTGSSEQASQLRQIALLQALIGVTDEGYSISEDGLTDISGITGQELRAHRDFFSGLSRVNAAVVGMPEVGDILTLDRVMLEELAEGLGRWRSERRVMPWELELAQGVYSVLTGLVDREVNELRNFLTDGPLVMTDAERIKRVVVMIGAVRRRLVLVREFCEGMDVLVSERRQVDRGR